MFELGVHHMTLLEHDETEYLTLKQASERFGYSPDYIGQLIRKGKIEGKQIVANVAWVTTEAAMRDYIAGNTSLSAVSARPPFAERFFSPRVVALLTWLLRIVTILLVLSGLLVFYFLSITIDDHLARVAERRLEERMASGLSVDVPLTHLTPMAYGE